MQISVFLRYLHFSNIDIWIRNIDIYIINLDISISICEFLQLWLAIYMFALESEETVVHFWIVACVAIATDLVLSAPMSHWCKYMHSRSISLPAWGRYNGRVVWTASQSLNTLPLPVESWRICLGHQTHGPPPRHLPGFRVRTTCCVVVAWSYIAPWW